MSARRAKGNQEGNSVRFFPIAALFLRAKLAPRDGPKRPGELFSEKSFYSYLYRVLLLFVRDCDSEVYTKFSIGVFRSAEVSVSAGLHSEFLSKKKDKN